MFFISLCADRTIANITLGASLNCQQSFRGLLCRSTLRQGRDEARDHELQSSDTDCAHVSDAHFLISFGMDVTETRSRSTIGRNRPFLVNSPSAIFLYPQTGVELDSGPMSALGL